MGQENKFLNDLQSSGEAVEKLQNERMKDGITYTMSYYIEQIKEQPNKIATIMSQPHYVPVLANFLTEEIKKKIDDNMVTPCYRPKQGPEQKVLMFALTHWSKLDQQSYYDFVNKLMLKIGVPENLLHIPAVVKQVYEQVALCFARQFKSRRNVDEVVINLQNGTLVFSDNGDVCLYPHNREDNFTYCLPYVYDPMAEYERFQQFLDEVLPEKEAQKLLAEFVACCFTRHVKIEKMLVLKGSGSNGKSVLMEILEALFGRENVSYVSLSDATNDDKKRALLQDKLVNISYESGKDVEPSAFKQLVSNEPVGAYINYQGPFTMYDYARFITSFNVMMNAENTYAFIRRIIILPFNVTITEEKADKNLAKKIIASELPGILNWVIDGMKRFIANKAFTESPLANEALHSYRLNSDSVRLFVYEQCEASSEFPTPGKELYSAYKKFCIDDNMKPLGSRNFYDRLEACVGSPSVIQKVKWFDLKLCSDNGIL